MPPILTTLVAAAAAVFAVPLGLLPLVGRERPPLGWLAWANAAAAGAMLGAAYAMTTPRAGLSIIALMLGGALGLSFTLLTQRLVGPSGLDLNRLEGAGAAYAYQITLVAALHSGSEGIAIGAAMALEERLGVAVALALALHKLPEALVLGAVLRGQGFSLARTGAIALAANSTQVLLAISTFAVITSLPGTLAWALGFAAGAFVLLTLTELLPEAYREAGPLPIAVAASLALSLVVLLTGLSLH